MKFEKKVVIITGGSSGIGAATAKQFAKEGAEVVIVGRNETKLAKVTEEIKKIGKNPLVIKADISQDNEARRVIGETVSKFGRIDILVNNAGFSRPGSILNGDVLQSYDEVMATNVRAVVNLTTLSAPYLVKTKGNIVNISSVAAFIPSLAPERISYSVSKAALSHFSRGAAVELASKGVRVNIVSPGPVVTDFGENSQQNLDLTSYSSGTLLNRVSQPEEIGDLVMFLASDKAKGITGSEFITDNGFMFKRKTFD